MPYEITCTHCGHNQYYKPRKDKIPKRAHTSCKKCGKDFIINNESPETISRIPKISKSSPNNKNKLTSQGQKKTINDSSTNEKSFFKNDPEMFFKKELLNPDLFRNVNIKTLLKNDSISEILNNGRNKSKAYDVLTKAEFIEQGDIKHGVYWTSDVLPYQRPQWVYPWQNVGIDLMLLGHCLWQAGRQKIGKTTGAFIADFEDMLTKPGTYIGLFAPGKDQATALLRQGFKEVITLDDGSKFDLWNQLFKPYFIVDNVNKKVMKNGSTIEAITLDENTTPGRAIDILHIEEIDKAVDDPQKLRALGAVLPTIRARRGYGKLRITCNNKSPVYRVLREELKIFGSDILPIYMEKPYNIETEKFTGNHYIYNEHIDYEGEADIDDILKVFLNAIMGKTYAQSQLGNLDDYEGHVWNPDKLDIMYEKGKTYAYKAHYEHTGMGIDPGAIHAFAITIWAMEGSGKNAEFVKLWSARYTISGRTDEEKERMVKIIAKDCAIHYLDFDCEFVASESNSGAKLIVNHIGYYVKKYKKLREQNAATQKQTYAEWNIIWSNWAGDKEEGFPSRSGIGSRADYIMLMNILIDAMKVTMPITNDADSVMKLEFARYNPTKKGSADNKYKGDMVDSSMICIWHLCGGTEFIETILAREDKEGGVVLL